MSIAQNHWTGTRTPRTSNLADLYSSCSLAPLSGLKDRGWLPGEPNTTPPQSWRIFSFHSLFLFGHGWSGCIMYAHGMRPGRRHMCRRRGKADQSSLALSCFCIVSSRPALDSSGSACSNSRRQCPWGPHLSNICRQHRQPMILLVHLPDVRTTRPPLPLLTSRSTDPIAEKAQRSSFQIFPADDERRGLPHASYAANAHGSAFRFTRACKVCGRASVKPLAVCLFGCGCATWAVSNAAGKCVCPKTRQAQGGPAAGQQSLWWWWW
jgi:hypothetical protein